MTSPRLARRDLAHVEAVDLDRALVDVVQPRHQVGRGRLARARRSDQRHQLAGLDLEVDVRRAPNGQPLGSARPPASSRARSRSARHRPRRPPWPLPSPAGPRTPARRPPIGSGTRRAGSGSRRAPRSGSSARASGASTMSTRQVEVLEDAVEQRQRALDLDLHVEQLAEREEQPRLERGEGDDVADRRRGRVALDGQPAGQPVDERRRDREDRADDHEEPAADHALADLERGELRVGVAGSGRPPASCWPNVLVSRMPLTLSVSSVIALMSARLSWVWPRDAPADLAHAVGQVHEERQQAERQAASAASR